MKKIYISTYPYCETSLLPIKLLKKNNIRFLINNKKRKHTEKEILNIIPKYDGLIADTEPLTKRVLDSANKLKIVSRVGIGLNSIDLKTAKEKKIIVAYTPDAPTLAVVDLTLGFILFSIRNVVKHHENLRKNIWIRFAGRRLPYLNIGIIGLGRIGSRVAKALIKLGAKKIFYNDLVRKKINKNIILKSKNFIYKNCDLISFHIPLTDKTSKLISFNQLKIMKKDCILINTARGEIFDERSLMLFLKKNKSAIAVLDVFEREPYKGKLSKLKNCIVTPHIGSMSVDCRERMELEATKSIINFFKKKKLKNKVKF